MLQAHRTMLWVDPLCLELVGNSAATVVSKPSELLPRKNIPDCPDGHMPYIRKCVFPAAWAIYFFTEFNPFGPSPGRTYYDEVNEETRKGWDGDPGPAQPGQGWGVTRYKQAILEAETIKLTNLIDPHHARLVERARARGESLVGLREEIAERYIDPRAGKSEHIAEEGGTCIMDEFAEVQTDAAGKLTGPSMEFIPASGVNQDEGFTAVNELLDWNDEAPLVAVLNQPHLFVSEDCQQVRWMFENYTGRAGEKGAAKDPADLVRYLALSKVEFLGEGKRGTAGRGF